MYENVERYNPDVKNGLSTFEVNQRLNDKLDNRTKIVSVKSNWDIIRTNVLSFFNILLFVVAGIMIFVNVSDGLPETPWYKGLGFLFILLCNVILGLYQDIKARNLMRKLHLLTCAKVNVVRDSIVESINPEELVLDDVMLLNNGDQICVDAIILSGDISVNESLLTGEPQSIHKTVGDTLYSGSYVVSGKCFALVNAVGNDTYVQSLQNSAKKFKRSPSKILSALNALFKILGIVIVSIIGIYLLIYGLAGKFSTVEIFTKNFRPIAGSVVGMIPAGLYLLTSVALAVGVITLARKRAQVQDFYSIEMLSHTDVLCIDKTGTITDGTLQVHSLIPLDKNYLINDIIFSLISATGDNNNTAKTLMEYCSASSKMDAISFLPFNSENKYSGVTLSNHKTYVMGAYEYLNIINKSDIEKSIKSYARKGYRVLVLCEGEHAISDLTYKYSVKAIGLIVLQDHIRNEAIDTFKWFAENGVDIKVISGDDALTVSEIALQAGIKHAENYISLEGMDNDQVILSASKYTVFGRVSPEQKEILINTLKENKKTVAMTGDGVNDILALKRADCSIAMASGAEAARNVSHIVLLDSNFNLLPDIVSEGRRVVNNLQRTCSLFLVKTVFTIFFTILFLILTAFKEDTVYPFTTSNLILWEVFTIGLPAFFIALQPNKSKPKTSFIKGTLQKTLPGAALIILGVGLVFILYLLSTKNIFYLEINNLKTASSLSVIVFIMLSIVVLFNVCRPLDKYRSIVFAGNIAVALSILIGIGVYDSFNNIENNVLDINFTILTPLNYLEAGIIVVICSTIYILAIQAFHYLTNEENNTK